MSSVDEIKKDILIDCVNTTCKLYTAQAASLPVDPTGQDPKIQAFNTFLYGQTEVLLSGYLKLFNFIGTTADYPAPVVAADGPGGGGLPGNLSAIVQAVLDAITKGGGTVPAGLTATTALAGALKTLTAPSTTATASTPVKPLTP